MANLVKPLLLTALLALSGASYGKVEHAFMISRSLLAFPIMN